MPLHELGISIRPSTMPGRPVKVEVGDANYFLTDEEVQYFFEHGEFMPGSMPEFSAHISMPLGLLANAMSYQMLDPMERFIRTLDIDAEQQATVRIDDTLVRAAHESYRAYIEEHGHPADWDILDAMAKAIQPVADRVLSGDASINYAMVAAENGLTS